jgi:hypothetical protein
MVFHRIVSARCGFSGSVLQLNVARTSRQRWCFFNDSVGLAALFTIGNLYGQQPFFIDR